ncbi:MAG: amidohydrolase family protein, partial [Chitinophagales bacterium]
KTRHPLDRMEHAQVTRLDQLDTLAKMDIPICIQPIFSSELSWARERLGPKRIETAYAWQEMISRGIRLLAGSDAPVDEADPHIAAETASEPTGAHHLDYQQCLQLFSRNNWEFYGISPV